MNIALRNLAYYWRGNLAVLLGVAVGAAVLIGALFVGDSLRGSLKDRAERQTNGVTAAWTGARLIDERVAKTVDASPALILRGTVRYQSTLARVTIIGLDAAGIKHFGLSDGITASTALGLRPSDTITLAIPTVSSVPRTSLLGRRSIDDLTTSIKDLTVNHITNDAAADFNLIPGPESPLNIYVPLKLLQERLGKPDRINAMFSFGGDAHTLNQKLIIHPSDWGLRVVATKRGYTSIESEQLILAPPVADALLKAVGGEPTTTYLANWISRDDTKRIPYSVVAAVDPNAAPPLGPLLPTGRSTLSDDEIVLVDWPGSPLKDAPLGTPITLTYFEPEVEGGAIEKSHTFKLAGFIPLAGAAADPEITPPFPGITDKLKIGDWDPPFPFESKRIKPGDANEQFWDNYKTTPKAYITRAAGERLWKSRFGIVTSVRVMKPRDVVEQEIAKAISPAFLGIQFDDIAARMKAASVGGQDFGMLFLGFSLFLILAALGLVGLLVRLTVERRARDLGLLLAAGFTPQRVRTLILTEVSVLALVGTLLGGGLAVLYARGLIAILADLWPDDSVKSILRPHLSWGSAVGGGVATMAMTILATWLAVRGLVKMPIPLLLKGRTEMESGPRGQRRGSVIAIVVCVLLAVVSLAVGPGQSNPDFRAGAFFSGGGLLFIAGLLAIRRWLLRSSSTVPRSLNQLSVRNAARFSSRSLLTVFLLGSASFLLVSVESFRRRPGADFEAASGGSGGFNLMASVDIPIFESPGTTAGRDEFIESYNQETQSDRSTRRPETEINTLLEHATFMPLRRHGGDDASCLNLYQAVQPRVFGVPESLIQRGGFQFSASMGDDANPWRLLNQPQADGAIPIIAEQNTVMWMLKTSLGGTIQINDGNGMPRKCRIVATLMDSVFQSEVLMSDANFRDLFPRDEGYSEFLIATPDAALMTEVLQVGLRRQGMIVTKTSDRVAAYQAVIGTYLTTFQLLGGLGLLLGILGLAAVVVRGVWDRISEFALFAALGTSPAAIRRLVLIENLFLLALGLALGIGTAVLSVLPQGASILSQLPRLAIMLAIIACAGIIAVVIATRFALRVPLLNALRSD